MKMSLSKATGPCCMQLPQPDCIYGTKMGYTQANNLGMADDAAPFFARGLAGWRSIAQLLDRLLNQLPSRRCAALAVPLALGNSVEGKVTVAYQVSLP